MCIKEKNSQFELLNIFYKKISIFVKIIMCFIKNTEKSIKKLYNKQP